MLVALPFESGLSPYRRQRSVAAAEEVVERVKAQAIDEKLKDEEYVTELLRGILTDILEEAEVPGT